MISKYQNYILYGLIVVSAVVVRLVPHEWNFAPVTGVAIFAAMYLPLRHAVGLTLGIRLISDFIIGFFSWPLMIAVYFSHLFGVACGLWVKKNKTFGRTLTAPIVSAIVFFLVTNFAWLYSAYPNDLSGVILAYTNGLPFLRGTLLGDMFYTLALVGSYEAVRLWYARKARYALENVNQ